MPTAGSVKLKRARFHREPRLSRTVRKGRRRLRWVVVALSVGLVGVVLLHVWVRLQVVRLGYALSSATKLQGQLEQERRELTLELATLTSPERLETMARKRLGLVPPEKGQVIVLP